MNCNLQNHALPVACPGFILVAEIIRLGRNKFWWDEFFFLRPPLPKKYVPPAEFNSAPGAEQERGGQKEKEGRQKERENLIIEYRGTEPN